MPELCLHVRHFPAEVAWSPDGSYVATASDDTTLRVWDAATGACLRILQAHTHYAFCCAFSAGSNLLVR
jgi:COMPASS component SWD3